MDMIYAVIIFVVGSSIQAGAVNITMLFIGKLITLLAELFFANIFSGRSIAGFAVGMLTMVIPLYISEVPYALI
jgi:flagellar biosynthesis protein FliQ